MTHAAPPLEADIVAPSAWTAANLAIDDRRVPVSDACVRVHAASRRALSRALKRAGSSYIAQ